MVFEGGGVKGLAYISALRTLEEEKVISLDEIKRVGGTSAGAVTALLVGLGFNLDEIEHLSNIKKLTACTLPQIKFSQLLDEPHGTAILAAKNKNWSEEINKAKAIFEKFCKIRGPKEALKLYVDGTVTEAKTLISELGQEFSNVIEDLSKNKGLCSGETLSSLVDMLIRQQYAKKLRKKIEEIREPLTFKELKTAGFKDLYFVGVNTETGTAEYFSYENTPDMLVANAVRISMSIPGVFTPEPLTTKDSSGQLHKSKVLYVDGGVLLNYPIRLFDYDLDENGHFNRDGLPKINKATLGLRLNPKTNPIEPRSIECPSTSLWAQSTVKNLGANYQESEHRLNGDTFRTVYIDVPSVGVGTLDFERVEEEQVKQLLTQIGIAGAHEFAKRTSQHQHGGHVELPEDIKQVYLNHFIIVDSTTSEENQIEPIYKLNPKCPALVLAFYKHNDKNLHDYLLYKLGILLCTRDEYGRTAYHLAVQQGEFLALERLLIENPNGAHLKNGNGKTPYQLAEEAGNSKMMALLKTYAQCASTSKQEEKSTGTSSIPFFNSSQNMRSSSGYYDIVLKDVKKLLEEVGKHDFEAYTTYVMQISELGKMSKSYQALTKLQDIETILKSFLKDKPEATPVNFDMF